ncbi:MAG: hypothetical protein ABF260_02155 [Flavobacteriaceae bacterium]
MFLYFSIGYSQQKSSFWIKSDTLNKSRRNALIISETALAGTTLLALDQLWYSDYPRSNFQLVNDNNQWKQMDKVSHIILEKLEWICWIGLVSVKKIN